MNVDFQLGDTQLILDYCRRKGLLRNQTAYILATCYWETAHTMLPVEEAYYLEGRISDLDGWRRRNLRYYPWHGRGYTQTTWERNYQRLKQATGVDVIANPSLAMDPEVAVVALVDGAMEGWWTGKKIGDYITLKQSDFVGARRVVNGTDKAQAIAEIAREYDRALKNIGYGVGEKDVPIVNERRDGSPPRSNPAQSTTIQAVGAAALTTVAQMADQAQAVVARVSDMFGVTPNEALALVTLAALAWVFRERIRKWSQGDR